MPDDEQPKRDRPPAPDPLADYPVGPDDAGNAVMAAYAFAVRGRRWLVDRIRRSPS
ncbi:MAG: hypothetical protein RIB65_16190 [Ilumatobacter fluminis]|uniref:Uncharacterized protein n=1 Tax=Ilumatobacter fluminis TaxID=467091 RepID=A0A4R7HVU7_9ACTN|nr:hypothetical protein [Ilumatobacter fluminis]TDT15102.1 hypothetical protein BDK89_0663 [Ilumatobacter fluminis]